MTRGLLNTVSNTYPIPDIAIKLLNVMLTIMATHAGKMLKTSGGGKNSQR
jgi:hypothetical protein